MRKKVLLVLPNLNGGGAERVMITLLKYFDRKRANYYFITVEKSGPYVTEIPNDIDVIDLEVQNKFFFNSKMPRVQWKLIQEINKIQPDVILTTLTEMNITILSIRHFLRNNPKIVIRETNPPSPRWGGKKLRIMRLLYSSMYPKADKIIAISEGVKKDLLEFAKIKENKIKVIYNPLSIKDIQRLSKEPVEYPSLLNDTFKIVTIGRLTPQKDFPTLLRAIKLVNKKYRTQLTILGEGNEYDNLRLLAEKLGIADRVCFLGFKSNPYPYLKNSDLFVLSSIWEGFGLVIVEALATGTPVVATNSNGAPKEILDDGTYGILVPIGDERKLAEAISKVLNKDIIFDEDLLLNRSLSFDADYISNEYLNLLLLDR